MAITVATDGAALTVLAEVAIGVGIGVGSYLLFCAISGEQVTAEGVLNAAVDSFVLSSFFAFVSAGINALSKIHRTSVEPTKEICTGWQCFIAGTLVLCKGIDGKETHKPIEEIEVGDMVLAYDEQTGVTDWKPVVRLFRNETQEWHHIKVNNEEIVCTGEHPFYEAELKQFIPANKLKTGNKLLLSDGRCVTINAIEIEQLNTPETTYNFEVADFHTYYVTESSVLVHNECYLNPNDINYTQNSISNKFSDGRSIDDMIGALKSGALSPDEIPALNVFKYKGKVYSINNRRLFAYKMAGVEKVPVNWVSISQMRHKFSAMGTSIIVRGGSKFL